MPEINYLAIAVLMGSVLVVVAAAAQWGRRETLPSPRRRNEEHVDLFTRIERSIGRIVDRPTTWYALFFVLTIGLVVGVVALFSEPDLAEMLLPAVGATIGGLIVAFFFAGIYYAIRNRGGGNAHAVGMGLMMLGMIFLGVVLFVLVT